MRRLALVATASLIGFSVWAADPASSSQAFISGISSDGGTLSFDGFRLGMTLEEARTLSGKDLVLKAGSEGVKAIDRYAVSLTHHETKLDLTFESDSPSSALVFIRARYPSEGKTDVAGMLEALKAQAPALAAVDGSVALMMPGTDYQVEPREDGLYLGANWLF